MFFLRDTLQCIVKHLLVSLLVGIRGRLQHWRGRTCQRSSVGTGGLHHWRRRIGSRDGFQYTLGANVADLSMQYWDIDEHHAFEGDRVLLKPGYSTVIDHLYKQLKERGERFQ